MPDERNFSVFSNTVQGFWLVRCWNHRDFSLYSLA